MCGIVGIISERNVAHLLLQALQRLEYRGYDSAGLAVLCPKDQQIKRHRRVGKVATLSASLEMNPQDGQIGIAHTRWATHGSPTEDNAHPHLSNDRIALVHNGIIENNVELRHQLQQAGYTFYSDTDSETICHLIDHHYQQGGTPLEALKTAADQLEGAFAVAVMFTDHPNTLYAIRRGSPLVIGIGTGEHHLASDVIALLPMTQTFVYLEEGDFACIDTKQLHIYDADLNPVTRPSQHTEITDMLASKGHYRHFMLKEIFEQPVAAARSSEQGIEPNPTHSTSVCLTTALKSIERVRILGCGTSHHAGMVACYWIEQLLGLSCQVDTSSELQYRHTVIETNTLLITLSQSGETADTINALKALKANHPELITLSICNHANSTLTRLSDYQLITAAGPEIGVAATKTFTTQLVAILKLIQTMSAQRQLPHSEAIHQALLQLPRLLNETLAMSPAIEHIACKLSDQKNMLFIGRQTLYPIALEGALKLKEIAYVFAHGYAAGELKHGPLALVDKSTAVVVLASNNALKAKLDSNINEIRARGGKLIIISETPLTSSDLSLTIPESPELLKPILFNIPLQLLSYHIAVIKGTDIDQPRNLAKSVTVE